MRIKMRDEVTSKRHTIFCSQATQKPTLANLSTQTSVGKILN